MLKFFKAMSEASRKGNEYRLEKYGKPQTIVESYLSTRKIRADNKQNRQKTKLWPTANDFRSLDLYKAQFDYWDEWSGSVYHRRDNPYTKLNHVQWRKKFLTSVRPKIETGSVVRSCSFTGVWKPISEFPDA